MDNLTRVTAKIFGETASTTNDPVEIGQFGSAKLGTYNATSDVATIQNLTAWSNGWIDAVTPTQQFPTLPEMTGVHKVLSYQNAYLMQKGIPEWDASTTYYTGDFAKAVGQGKLYYSLTDNNLNHALSNTTYWQEFNFDGTSLLQLVYPVGSIFLSTTVSCPLAALFGTWQIVGNTIITGVAASGSTSSTSATVSVKGNGKSLGLTNGSINAGTAYYSNSGAGSQLYPNTNAYGTTNGTTNTHAVPSWTAYASVGVTTDSSKSGLTGSVTIPSLSVSVSNTSLSVNIFKRTA